MRNVLTVALFLSLSGFAFVTMVQKYSEGRAGIKQFACMKAKVSMNDCKIN